MGYCLEKHTLNSKPYCINTTLVLRLYCVILSFFFVSLSFSQADFTIKQFNSENGMQNEIKDMELDKHGFLWLATEIGLTRYDGSHFKLFNTSNTPELKTDQIINIGLTKDSMIYAESADHHFYFINGNGQLKPVASQEVYKSLIVIDHAMMSSLDVYMHCKSMFDQHQIQDWAVPDYGIINRSVANDVTYLNGNYYYFNKNREIIKADTNFTAFTKFKFTGAVASIIHKDSFEPDDITLIKSRDGLYFHLNEMVYKLGFTEQDSTVNAAPVLYVDDIMNITSFVKSRQHDIYFIGTKTDGFYVFQKKFFSTVSFKDTDVSSFYAQASYEDSGVVTKNGVLYPNKYIPFKNNYAQETILKTTNGHYVFNKIIDENNSAIVEVDKQFNQVNYIPGKKLNIKCFKQSNDNEIWLAADNHFLGKVRKNGIQWTKQPEVLSRDFNINSFVEAENNQFWVGGNKGLAKIDVAKKSAHIIPGLKNIPVRTLYKDDKNTIWIGTYGKGFYAWYKNNLVQLPLDEEHYLATNNAFIQDKTGHLWISTNRGLFEADLKDLYSYLDAQSKSVYYYYYDRSAGFLTNEFDGGCEPAAVKLNNGKFSLPSAKGLVQFYPDSIDIELPDSDIYIDNIIADTTLIESSNNTIKIPGKTKHLQFTVSSPYYGNSYNQVIEYKLSGTDDEWYNVGDDGTIELNQLPYGNYSLMLRKKAGFGKDNYITNQVSFYIQPAFYETWLFKIIVIVLFAALLYGIYRLRVLYLIKQKTKLENEVAERTKEQQALIENLEEVVEQLEESQENLYQTILFKDKLAMIIGHDLQSPLRFLNDAANRLHETSLQQPTSTITETSKELQNTSQNLYNFIKDFNLWLNNMGQTFNVQNTWVNVSDVMHELMHFFSHLLNIKKNKIILHAEPTIKVYTDYQLLKIILRNIIDNANKYTRQGCIYIDVNVENGKTFIVIKDTGEGISTYVLDKLQRRIKEQGPVQYDDGKEMGIGYGFVIDFCKLLNITVEIKSDNKNGTSVALFGLITE